jgi:hypothetical protein
VKLLARLVLTWAIGYAFVELVRLTVELHAAEYEAARMAAGLAALAAATEDWQGRHPAVGLTFHPFVAQWSDLEPPGWLQTCSVCGCHLDHAIHVVDVP